MNNPDWLQVGQIVKVAEWPGIIIDVASADSGKTMVLINSPKAIAHGQRPEWVEYSEGMAEHFRPASFDEIAWLFEAYFERVHTILADLCKMRDEWAADSQGSEVT